MKKTRLIIISIISTLFVVLIIIFGLWQFGLIGLNNVQTEQNGENGNDNKKNVASEYSELANNLELLEPDVDFYKNIYNYVNLLDEEEYKKFKTSAGKLDSEENNEDLAGLITLIYVNELNKNNEVKAIIEDLKSQVYENTKKELSKDEENELFEKNNTCAQLITGITEQLKNKYENELSTTENEELKFITYSPTLKKCVYVTDYSYRYTNISDYTESYNYSSYIIYNATTNTKINDYTYYYYNYPYLSDEDEDVKSENNKKAYAKYILENTNYNVDLLKD